MPDKILCSLEETNAEIYVPLTGSVCLARRLHSAYSSFREIEGHGEVSVYLSRDLSKEHSHYMSIVQRKAKKLYLLFPP